MRESRAAKRYVKFAQNQYDEYHKAIGDRSSIRIDTPGTRRFHNQVGLTAQKRWNLKDVDYFSDSAYL